LKYLLDYAHQVDDWHQTKAFSEIREALDNSEIKSGKGCTAAVRDHISAVMEPKGWLVRVSLIPELATEVFLLKPGEVAIQVQLGNKAGGYYDLLKLQFLKNTNQIKYGVIVCFTQEAARKVNGNLVSFESIRLEHNLLWNSVISTPLVFIGIA
jgi:hypothetical protein